MLKVKISTGDSMTWMTGPCVWIYEELAHDRIAFAQPIHLIMEEQEVNQVIAPTFDLGNVRKNEQFIAALAEALAELKQPLSGDDHRIKVTLDATREHLHDLQKLLHLR